MANGKKERSVVGALEEIAEGVKGITGAKGVADELLANASGPYEEVFVRYSRGTGTARVAPDGLYIIVWGTMYKLDNEEDGKYEAVFKAEFAGPQDLTNYPKPAEEPFNKPSAITQVTYPLNQTKARWTFKDGSSLSGPGPAVSYIVALKEGGFQFYVSAAAFITGGTHRYDGALGQETSLGSTFFTSQPKLEDGFSFEAMVLHSFKVIRKADRA
jgi:hypothetical protein